MAEQKKNSMQSISSSYQSRAGFNADRDDTVQKMSASEHAGGRDADGNLREPVTPPEGVVPNTVNPDAAGAAATRPADEHQPDSGAEDPTVISGEGKSTRTTAKKAAKK